MHSPINSTTQSNISSNEQRWQQNTSSTLVDTSYSFLEKIWRWRLERREPDATGRWRTDDRRMILKYVYKRDGGRCGLCAGGMVLKGAHIEHVIPKIFAVFDIQAGNIATPGTQYRSVLHKLDNLQAAHSYCNKHKGNTPELAKWRHPSMLTLGVALSEDRRLLYLPGQLLPNSQ